MVPVGTFGLRIRFILLARLLHHNFYQVFKAPTKIRFDSKPELKREYILADGVVTLLRGLLYIIVTKIPTNNIITDMYSYIPHPQIKLQLIILVNYVRLNFLLSTAKICICYSPECVYTVNTWASNSPKAKIEAGFSYSKNKRTIITIIIKANNSSYFCSTLLTNCHAYARLRICWKIKVSYPCCMNHSLGLPCVLANDFLYNYENNY